MITREKIIEMAKTLGYVADYGAMIYIEFDIDNNQIQEFKKMLEKEAFEIEYNSYADIYTYYFNDCNVQIEPIIW